MGILAFLITRSLTQIEFIQLQSIPCNSLPCLVTCQQNVAVIRRRNYFGLPMFHYKRASPSSEFYQCLRAKIPQRPVACAPNMFNRPVAMLFLFRFEHVLKSHATLPIVPTISCRANSSGWYVPNQNGRPEIGILAYSVLTCADSSICEETIFLHLFAG